MTVEQAIAAGMSCFEHLAEYSSGHLRDGASIPAGADLITRFETTAGEYSRLQRS